MYLMSTENVEKSRCDVRLLVLLDREARYREGLPISV